MAINLFFFFFLVVCSGASKENEEVLEFGAHEHVYPVPSTASTDNLPIAVLYANVGASHFGPFHSLLS